MPKHCENLEKRFGLERTITFVCNTQHHFSIFVGCNKCVETCAQCADINAFVTKKKPSAVENLSGFANLDDVP